MTIKPYLGGDDRSSKFADDLGRGTPTLMALAELCGDAMRQGRNQASLSTTARAILFLARERGVFEVKATDNAFDSVDRFLTVHVEVLEHEHVDRIPLRVRGDAEATMRWFDAFRELCAAGLVMHHLFGDFSLTKGGFEVAHSVRQEDVAALLAPLSLNGGEV